MSDRDEFDTACLRIIMRGLDPDNDAHFEPDGKPKMEAVAELLDIEFKGDPNLEGTVLHRHIFEQYASYGYRDHVRERRDETRALYRRMGYDI